MSYIDLPDYSYSHNDADVYLDECVHDDTSEYTSIYQIQPKEGSANIMHVGQMHPDYISDIKITVINHIYQLLVTECLYTQDKLLDVKDYTYPLYMCKIQDDNLPSYLVMSFHTYEHKDKGDITNFLSSKNNICSLRGYYSVIFYNKKTKLLLKTYKTFTNFKDMISKLICFVYEPMIEELLKHDAAKPTDKNIN